MADVSVGHWHGRGMPDSGSLRAVNAYERANRKFCSGTVLTFTVSSFVSDQEVVA